MIRLRTLCCRSFSLFLEKRLIMQMDVSPQITWCRHCVRYSSTKSSKAKRLEKLGIGADGKRLPISNTRRLFPRMYQVLVVNQDGSSYSINHRYPHEMIPLPLDLSTLTEEERMVRDKQRHLAKQRKYVVEDEEEMEDEDEEWDQSQYRDLLR